MSGITQDALSIVHLALAAGVVVLAAVLFGVVGPLEVREGTTLRWIWLGLAGVAVLAAGVVRGRLAGTGVEIEKRRALAILIWALAEGQALAGLIFYLLSGDPVPAAAGVAVFFLLWWRHRPAALPGGS